MPTVTPLKIFQKPKRVVGLVKKCRSQAQRHTPPSPRMMFWENEPAADAATEAE